MQVRGIYHSLQPPLIEARITVVYIQHELSPADWLSIYLEQIGEQPVNQRYTKRAGGSVPDVLSVSGPAGSEKISRWMVLKDWAKQGGGHLFVVQVSTAARFYTADIANLFFVATSQFDLSHPTDWEYAERLRTLVRSEPIVFTTAFPESWQQLENPAGNKVLYQVQLTKSLNSTLAGRITLAIVAQRAEPDMRQLPLLFMEAYAKQGTKFDPLNFNVISPFGGLQQAWYARSDQLRAEPGHPVNGIIEIMVGQVGTNWVYIEQQSPSRGTSPEAWAITKRAYEIVLNHLRFL